MSRLEYTLKHNKILQRLYVFFGSLFLRFLALFIRPKTNYVLFQSMIGRTFGDSPKVIYSAMLKDTYFSNYKFFWAFVDVDEFDVPDATKVSINSFRYFITSLKCGIWVGNSGIERGLKYKHRKTLFINTGHGAAFKYIGNAVSNRRDFNFKDVDFFCTVSEMDKEIRMRDMGVRSEALKMIGYPVNDYLYDLTPEKIASLRKKYNIPDGKKVICYAPTWRESTNKGKSYDINPPIDINKWKKELSSDYVLMLRIHHLTTKILGISYDDFVLDGSSYFPSYEVLAITDLLISDYSSILFDFSILERPMFAFAYDYDDYRKKRGLYISPYDILPNSTFVDEDSLILAIKKFDYNQLHADASRMKKEYMKGVGNATSECIRFIKERTNKNGK